MSEPAPGPDRFVSAQDEGGTFERAIAELEAGRKTSHWMWFVFPQIAGLGQSPTARHFAIASLDEARDYMKHPVLGRRLVRAAEALIPNAGISAAEILGQTDAMKLRSSMTLFDLAAPEEPVFRRVLDLFFDGEPDENTKRILQS